MFLLVPAYPGCPGSKAVKRSLLFVVVVVMHFYAFMCSWELSTGVKKIIIINKFVQRHKVITSEALTSSSCV